MKLTTITWLIGLKTICMSDKNQNKNVYKDNERYTKAKQRCKQMQWDIYKG